MRGLGQKRGGAECGDWGKGGENCGVSERRWGGFKRGPSHDLNSLVWKSASPVFLVLTRP